MLATDPPSSSFCTLVSIKFACFYFTLYLNIVLWYSCHSHTEQIFLFTTTYEELCVTVSISSSLSVPKYHYKFLVIYIWKSPRSILCCVTTTIVWGLHCRHCKVNIWHLYAHLYIMALRYFKNKSCSAPLPNIIASQNCIEVLCKWQFIALMQ